MEAEILQILSPVVQGEQAATEKDEDRSGSEFGDGEGSQLKVGEGGGDVSSGEEDDIDRDWPSDWDVDYGSEEEEAAEED